MTIQTASFVGSCTKSTKDQSPLSLKQVPLKKAVSLPETGDMADALLYLRHVEQGESIRSLARELGCHASTVMRRIRRYEARRDDPLIDQALNTPSVEMDAASARRILRRLAEKGAELAVATDMEKAVITREGIRVAVIDRRHAEALALCGWIERTKTGRISLYQITRTGRATLRTLLARRAAGKEDAGLAELTDFTLPEGAINGPSDISPQAESHRIYAPRDLPDPETGRRRRMRVNIAESPMLILARRRMPDGSPFLTAEMVAAGERLREDFELAQMGPRVTQNWDRFMTAGVDGGRFSATLGGGSQGARDRVGAALRDLGPGMGDLVLRVCCYLEGIEATEQRLGWSARSGKVVLRLALHRLARHYAETYGAGSPLIG